MTKSQVTFKSFFSFLMLVEELRAKKGASSVDLGTSRARG